MFTLVLRIFLCAIVLLFWIFIGIPSIGDVPNAMLYPVLGPLSRFVLFRFMHRYDGLLCCTIIIEPVSLFRVFATKRKFIKTVILLTMVFFWGMCGTFYLMEVDYETR